MQELASIYQASNGDLLVYNGNGELVTVRAGRASGINQALGDVRVIIENATRTVSE